MRTFASLPSWARRSWLLALALAVIVAVLVVSAVVQKDAVVVTNSSSTLAPSGTLAPGGTLAPSGTVTSGEAVTLMEVVDGDTIRVRMPDDREEKVRYIGIDAPEIAHEDSQGEYLGGAATSHNAELLASGALRLATDVDERDDFGRLLAYVWAGEVFVNQRMVLDGYARAHNYPPNLTRQEQLWAAHDQARAAGIGIWSGEGR